MLLVLNSFIKSLSVTKSKACKLDLVNGQVSRPYKRRHLLLIYYSRVTCGTAAFAFAVCINLLKALKIFLM